MSARMPPDIRNQAYITVAMESVDATILSCTFNRIVALDRAKRSVSFASSRADPPGQAVDSVVIAHPHCSWDANLGFVPYVLPEGAIAFSSYTGEGMSQSGDIFEAVPTVPGLPNRHWCILDVRVLDPTRIIPATILDPYPTQPGRRQAELNKTDALPIWFWKADGSLGIPITTYDFDNLLEKDTRIRGTSLKVGFWVSRMPSTHEYTLTPHPVVELWAP